MKLSLKDMKFSGITRIGMILVGVVLIGWIIALATGVFDPPRKVGLKQVDPNRCPNCNHPLTAYAKQEGHCLFCKAELPGHETTTFGASKIIAAVLIGLFVVLFMTNAIFTIRDLSKSAKKEEGYYVTNCRKCGRRVRFREPQCGQIVKCPTCRQLMRFPDAPEKPRGVWTRMKGWLTVKGKKKVNQTAK